MMDSTYMCEDPKKERKKKKKKRKKENLPGETVFALTPLDANVCANPAV